MADLFSAVIEKMSDLPKESESPDLDDSLFHAAYMTVLMLRMRDEEGLRSALSHLTEVVDAITESGTDLDDDFDGEE